MPLNPNPYPVASRAYMPYVIYAHSAAQVAAWRAEFGYGLVEGPSQAAARLGLPFPPGGPLTDVGIFYKYPFLPARKIPIIVDPAEQFPSALDDWIVMGGPRYAPDGTVLPTIALTWVGIFQQMGGKAGDTYPPTGALPTGIMSRRRWVDGFETPGGEGNVAADPGEEICRDASRTADGFGLALRSTDSSVEREHTVMAWLGGGTSDRDLSWERIYIRARRYPTSGEAELMYFKAIQSNGSQGAEGTKLFLDVGGRINVYAMNNSSVLTQVAAGPVLALNTWYRLDVLHQFSGTSAVANPGRFASTRLYVNNVQEVDVGPYSIINQVRANTNRHDMTRLGQTGMNGAEIDFDDWIAADPPIVSPDTGIGLHTIDFTALEAQYDFQTGSHVQRVKATAFGSGHSVNWTGDFRALVQGPGTATASASPGFQAITSTTALARAEVETNLRADDANFWTDIFQLGSIAFEVSTIVQITTAGAATEGYKIGAAADVSVAFGAGTGKLQGNGPMYNPVPGVKPTAVTPLKLFFTKSNNAGADGVFNLVASVELLGAHGPEDAMSLDAPVVLGAFNGVHNAPYSPSAFSAYAPAPLSPIVVQTGTYVGNGTAQDITLASPANLLIVRNTATHEGVRWWSSQLFSHAGLVRTGLPHLINDALLLDDTVNQKVVPTVRIGGTNVDVNAAGVTYRYVAVSDLGQRYMINGACNHEGLAAAINALLDTAFTPTWAFFHAEELDSSSATAAQFAKGPGNTANGASPLNATETADAATFSGAGELTTRTALNSVALSQLAYCLLRTVDGSGTTHVCFQILTYTGDGVSPRTIALTPTSGKRPLYAIVVPRNAASVDRDPSHAGTNSRQLPATNVAANGIRGGGIDQIIVGSQLNANGIAYSVLVIPGGVTGNADGWSDPTGSNPDLPGVFIPAPHTGTPGGPSPAPPPDPDTGGGGSGTDPADGDGPTLDTPVLDDDLADDLCVAPTVAIANLALSRIGSNAELTAVSATDSAESTAIRRHYDLSLQATLKDRPWPFATRYASLTLLAGSVGSPANPDWTFAYRLPDDCLQARRLAVTRGTAVDPTMPPFREAQGVLFTNEVSPRLEYTARVHCPARVSDPTFLNAWGWRLAHEIAPALTRIPEKQAECWAQYERALVQFDTYNKLGAPGPRPTANPSDPDALCAAVKLQAINVGLLRIGAKTIASLANEQSREAVSANLAYEDELQAVLRDHAWSFARRYTDPVTLVRGPAWTGATVQAWSSTQAYAKGDTVTDLGIVYYALAANTGSQPPSANWTTTPTTEANNDWTYAYRLPANMLRFLRVERRGEGRRAIDVDPPPFELGSDDTGGLIMTDEADAILCWITRPNCALAIGDALFRDAFSWRLAAVLAPSLAAVDPDVTEQHATPADPKKPARSESGALRLQQLREQRGQYAWTKYYQTLNIAEAATSNEQQQLEDGDAQWIRDRD